MREIKEKSERRQYDEEFKANAVRLIESGKTVREVAQSLGVSEGLLQRWKREQYAERPALEAENAELRARLRELEQERDILKKALSIFSRPG
jgi:transposase